MARAIEIFLSFSLIFTTIWACKDGQVDQLTARQGLDELLIENSYPTNPWMFPYNYNIQPRLPFAGYANSYEGRIPFNRKPPGNFANINADYYDNQEGRLGFGNLGANLFNMGLLSNLFTPLTPLSNLLNRMEACTSPSDEAGMCSSASACSSISGRPSGSCTQGRVCCINVVKACASNATRNNTYWQSPSTSVSSPCSLTVHLDNKLAEQASPICQIRLDFVSFTNAPPTVGTCTDTFTVEGATTMAPTICGVNSGQHMYLDVPSSATTPTDVKLIFKFATGTTTTPSWNIKIAMLPCGATYLAPADCLQYFASATGKVKSFNWQDTAAARQLNNQNYNICFRTELVAGARATQMCVSPCTGTLGNAFFLTGQVPLLGQLEIHAVTISLPSPEDLIP
ncbi:uncharacterized protein LOC124316349 isoform X2 [Daphnia pulicaria]|uniref:uncharacterized protein LOC124316349 isoform X2 n=1 Tax=Daphnia pulicaria TaxID=35523 RepID=UPI001EEBA619|nr:uncharacterized protein LOC124316349 isoform X2 [Daphnia pulicaria]